jgi:hypothetical protein
MAHEHGGIRHEGEIVMPEKLPLLPAIQNSRVSCVIGDSQFLFDIRWNNRDESWYMDMRDQDEDLIVAGMRIVLGSPLGARTADSRFPPGVFLAIDTTNSGQEATYDDLGERVIVMFFSPEELAAL